MLDVLLRGPGPGTPAQGPWSLCNRSSRARLGDSRPAARVAGRAAIRQQGALEESERQGRQPSSAHLPRWLTWAPPSSGCLDHSFEAA